MKLIFESLNDYEMSRLELATISEGIKDSFENGKKWIIEQVNKFIKFIKEFINKYIKRIPKGTMLKSLDVSRLITPSEILDDFNDGQSNTIKTKEAMTRYLLKKSTNYVYDDSLNLRDNIIKCFGMKDMTINEINNNIKLIERHLNDIKSMAEKKFSYIHDIVSQYLLPIYNTILSIVTESFKKDNNKHENVDTENSVEGARQDIINQYRFDMYSSGDSKTAIYSKKFSDLYQDDDGDNGHMTKDKSKWSHEDYKATLLVKTRKNFSKEKVNHLSTVTKYLSDMNKERKKKGSDWGTI